MKVGELARRTGFSAHTIRYYERIGLLPYANRDQSGQRDYDDGILVWINFLGRLKATGMPIKEMLRYAKLRDIGASTEAERSSLLEEHRERVRAKIEELQACCVVLDTKIAGYNGSEKRTNRHDAKLTSKGKSA